MLTVADFRSAYPEFSDPDRYSDGQLGFWLTISQSLVESDRWLDLTDLAVGLATAHQVAIANQSSAGGGSPGAVSGPITSKSVDRVSVTMDTSGFWNMTTYGIRFLQLARMFGAGPVQL